MSAPVLWGRVAGHEDRIAVADDGGSHRYAEIVAASARVARRLLAGRPDLGEARVAFLVPPSFAWVALQWGVWRAGGVAVPLSLSHPEPELRYVVEDTDAEILIAAPELAPRLAAVAGELRRRVLAPQDLLADRAASGPLPEVAPERRAMILYTSGTTSRPKGVVTTHANLAAQVDSLLEAWGWRPTDRILLCLPLHHTHGIVNVVLCALAVGATCEMLPRFDAGEVWRRIESGRLTLFMAVPTIYARLIAGWETEPEERRRALSAAAGRLRLMVSGSAALPVSMLERWREITGHTLLERYGMTEIGMALSNPLDGERVPGHVGRPLPGVEVLLGDETGRPVGPDEEGEILVRGPGVFAEYWRRPEASRGCFRDGWFRTGDVAVEERGGYRILGRQSVDILKTGGYKVSALEIEEVLRRHPAVAECAVVGLPDPEWGERVVAAVVLEPGAELELETLRGWSKERLAPYKIPSRLEILDELPRNALGKVTKPDLVRLLSTSPRLANEI